LSDDDDVTILWNVPYFKQFSNIIEQIIRIDIMFKVILFNFNNQNDPCHVHNSLQDMKTEFPGTNEINSM